MFLAINKNGKKTTSNYSNFQLYIFRSECGDIWTEPDDFRCKHSCHNAKTMCLYDFHSHGKKCFCLGDKLKGKI